VSASTTRHIRDRQARRIDTLAALQRIALTYYRAHDGDIRQPEGIRVATVDKTTYKVMRTRSSQSKLQEQRRVSDSPTCIAPAALLIAEIAHEGRVDSEYKMKPE